MPPPVPVGMPSQLLERRPDVVAAERRVAAAFDRVGEARAAQLPRIALTAGGSSVSSSLLDLKDTSNPIWGIGGNLLAPIYQGGALRAQVEIRSAEQKQAVAEYARTGQRAFGEVENALAAENALRERDAILEVAIRDNERALELAQIQYRVGVIDLRGVEQNQLSLYVARMSRLRVQTERLAQRVNLYLALGGGFDAAGDGAGGGGRSRPLAHPELIHQHERIGPVRLEPVPVVEIGQRRIVGETRPVARRRIGVRPFEADEFELELREQLRDPRQREALLLDVEDEVAAAAQAVEILAPRDPREERRRPAGRGSRRGTRGCRTAWARSPPPR